MDALRRRTRRIFAFRKGILALDTAADTLGARFSRCVGMQPGAGEAYRDMLLSTPDLAITVSAVVLTPEAFGIAAPSRRLAAVDDAPGPHGRALLDRVRSAGILVGARADTGSESLSTTSDEQVTSGLDGLSDRLRRLQALGASFAVWSMSSGSAIDYGALRTLTVNSQAAARFAYTLSLIHI